MYADHFNENTMGASLTGLSLTAPSLSHSIDITQSAQVKDHTSSHSIRYAKNAGD